MNGRQPGPYDPYDQHHQHDERDDGDQRDQHDQRPTRETHHLNGPRQRPHDPESYDPHGMNGPQDPRDPDGTTGAPGAFAHGAADPGTGPDGLDDLHALLGLGGSGRGGASGPGGPDTPTGPQGPGDDGDDGVDEQELRRLLRGAVRDLEPAPDSLEHLRRAVPARRQRRRHAVLGAAAALLVGGTSIPAVVHVTNTADTSQDMPHHAAGSRQAPEGTTGAHGEGTERRRPSPTVSGGKKGEKGKPEEKGQDKGQDDTDSTLPGASPVPPAPTATMDVTSPVCARDQLGSGSGTVGPADSAGRIYGAFRVVNTSSTACSVEGGGVVGAVAKGSADSSRIHVVDHTSGDAATGLPDPVNAPGQFVLKPGQAYEVKFAWVPAQGGGTSGCAAEPKPTPTPGPSQGPSTAPETSTGAKETEGGQAGGGEGTPTDGKQPPSVALSHTPEQGEPAAADTQIPDACAGTIYRTEALPAQ